MISQVPLGKAEVVLRSTGFLLEPFQAVLIKRTAQVPLDGLVEGYLFECSASVGVGGNKCVRIGIDEHAHRQVSHSKHDLRCRLVLAVEDIDRASAPFGPYPSERHVKLWTLLMELLNQLRDVGPDRTRVDVVIM